MSDKTTHLHSDRLLKDIKSELGKLAKDVDNIKAELGVRQGKDLSNQVDRIDRDVATIKEHVNEIKVDTSNMRKKLDFGSRTDDEIKRALAAIYRQTDELEKNLIEDRRTF